jgi:PAS domain-containing protein
MGDNSKINGLEKELEEKEIQELCILEDYIRDLWRFFPIPMAHLNPRGVIMDSDTALGDLLGRSQDDILGTRLADYFSNREEILNILNETMDKGLVRERQARVKTKEAEATVIISCMARKDGEGNIIGLFVSLMKA